MATKTLTVDVPASETASMEAAVEGFIEKIDRSLQRSKRTQARIDKLKAGTAVIRARAQARMEKLCGKSF